MRVLLVNPNISPEATDAFVALARGAAAAATEIVPATGAFGAALMGSPAETAIGTHAALTAIAEHLADPRDEPCDAVIVAAFGDYGVTPARDLFHVPVVGIAEAALAVVGMLGQSFAIVTIGSRMAPVLTKLVADAGLEERFAGVHISAPLPDGDAFVARTVEACAAAAAAGASSVVIVGPPLAAIHARISERSPVPVVEGVSCAVKMCEMLVALGVGRAPAAAGASTRRIEGVSPALIDAIRRRHP